MEVGHILLFLTGTGTHRVLEYVTALHNRELIYLTDVCAFDLIVT